MAERICSIDGCDRAWRAMGFCATHYASQRFRGEVCAAEGCATHPRAAGLCEKHYQARRTEGQACSVEGCGAQVKNKGLCLRHYRQADAECAQCGSAFTGDGRRRFCSPACKRVAGPCGYAAVHRRLRVDLGKAGLHDCVDCAGPALHWSYTYGDLNELIGDRGSSIGLPYSTDSAFYVPRCAPCHRRFDHEHPYR